MNELKLTGGGYELVSPSEKITLTANILFSGIGCQERGFRDSNLFEIDVISTSDINKESVLSYAAVHCGLTNEMIESYESYPSRQEMANHLSNINLGYIPEKDKKFDWSKLINRKSNDLEKYWLACKLSHNLGDISGICKLPYADLWTCSFPCTDISVAGKMKGLDPDSGTRSSLLWENIRLLKTAKDNNELPKYILVENVKNLVGKKFIDSFNDLLKIFDELGFNSYWSVMNGKDCGVPQNRERVFIISIRKDIDKKQFSFPFPFDNGLRLKDILEKSVAEEFYLGESATKKLKIYENKNGKDIKIVASVNPSKPIQDRTRVLAIDGISQSLRATDYKDPVKILQVAQMYRSDNNSNPQAGRIYSDKGISPTIDTCSGGNTMPKIIEAGQFRPQNRNYNKDGEPRKDRFETRKDGYSNALLTAAKDNCIREDYRVRRLTPRECWRLMGLTYEDCDKAKALGIAKTHLYKQAGNGIITNCCELIAEHLYKAQYNMSYICTDEKANRQS